MTLEGEDKKGNAVSVCDVDNLENLCCALATAETIATTVAEEDAVCHENVLTINGAAAAGDFTQDMVDRVPRPVWDFDHDLTADKICYGDDDKHCTGLFKDLEEAPPPTNPDLTEQSKIAPCTYAWWYNDMDDVTTRGPGQLHGAARRHGQGLERRGVQREPLRLRAGHRRDRLSGGAVGRGGRTCGSPASLRPCTALDVLARGETFVEQHDDRNWAFFYVWEEGPRGASVSTPTEEEPFAGVLAVGIMMFQGPKSVLELAHAEAPPHPLPRGGRS